MPDTFDPQYSWLKTWKENPNPPILFYGTSSNLIHEIREHGLTPRMEEEHNPITTAQHILSSARKLGDKRTAEQAELILLEHEEKPGPLKLTFNYHRALHLARKKSRRIEALQWLCEEFGKRTGQYWDQSLAELASGRATPPPQADGIPPGKTVFRKVPLGASEANYSCNEMCDLHLSPLGVVIYVRTDLSKFQNLSPLLEDKKELKRALKGKPPKVGTHGNHGPIHLRRTWWKKPAQSEVESCLEKSIRGDQDHPGLGEEVFTLRPIPPSDIVRIELPSGTVSSTM